VTLSGLGRKSAPALVRGRWRPQNWDTTPRMVFWRRQRSPQSPALLTSCAGHRSDLRNRPTTGVIWGAEVRAPSHQAHEKQNVSAQRTSRGNGLAISIRPCVVSLFESFYVTVPGCSWKSGRSSAQAGQHIKPNRWPRIAAGEANFGR